MNSSPENPDAPPPSLPAAHPKLLETQGQDDRALALPGITGTTLASFALSHTVEHLSVSDLNLVGMELMKAAAASKDFRAASSVFGTLAAMNKQAPTGRVGTSNDDLAKLLRRSAKGMATRTVDVVPEE